MSLRNVLMCVSLLLSVAIGWTLSQRGAPSGGESKPKGKVTIGLSLDTLKEARWQADRDEFVKAAGALGAEVLVQSANSNDTKQMQDVESLLSRGVDVLVIVPHDGKAMGRAVDVAAENGVPVISYDRLITNTGKLDAYISFDNVRVGEMQAKFLEEKIPPGGKLRIVRIYGSPTDNNARLFKKGQDQILEPLIQAGKIEVVHEDWAADWKPENAKKIVNAAITRTPQGFDAVLASNDGTAGGAVQALLEEGLAGKVVVTGQDAELPALQRIVAGTQAMTIYKPIKNLAREAAALAVKLAGGKPVVLTAEVADGDRQIPSLLLDVTTVTKDNLEATVIQDGFHTRESVYGK